MRTAGTEAHLLLEVGSRDVERVRIGKHRLVTVARVYQSTTFSPSAIFTPLSSVSRVAVRRKWITGVA